METDKKVSTQAIALSLLEAEGATPESVVTKLLNDAAQMAQQLESFGSVTKVEPTQDPGEKQQILGMAITNGVRQLHTAFHLCGVLNRIKTTVKFPDGEYELQFGKASKVLTVLN